MVFDLSKPAVKAIKSPMGGGWVVPLNETGTRVLFEYFGNIGTPIAPLGNQVGYIVEPWEAGDLVEYLINEKIAWEVA